MQGRTTRRPTIRVFGYHLTGSTGTLFLFGIAVGAVASLGLCLLLAGARCTASRTADARRSAARFSVGDGAHGSATPFGAARFQRDMAFINRARDTRLEHQQRADSAAVTPAPR